LLFLIKSKVVKDVLAKGFVGRRIVLGSIENTALAHEFDQLHTGIVLGLSFFHFHDVLHSLQKKKEKKSTSQKFSSKATDHPRNNFLTDKTSNNQKKKKENQEKNASPRI
jgi:hypothetical protein